MTTYLITGTNTGIGRATLEALAARGGRIIAAARSRDKMAPIADDLRARFPATTIELLSIDLADLASVRAAAQTVLASGAPLDVLINNAGVAGAAGLTRDGFEMTFGTNHLGPFVLTEMLLPRLREAPQSRVVNVASQAQFNAKRIDWSALRKPGVRKTSYAAYGLSKLMNVLYTKELARRLAGTRVTTYALHPGVVKSDIWRNLPPAVQWIMKRFMITNEKGAVTTVYCATAPELAKVSGRYYNKSREAPPNPLADDESLARELVTWSEAAVAGVLGPSWRT